MIQMDRGQEPESLANERDRRLASAELDGRPRASGEFGGYSNDDVRNKLNKQQGYRCAYCEIDLDDSGYPIEHFRPKALRNFLVWDPNDPAPSDISKFYEWFDALPLGAQTNRTHWSEDHERYWWLAWTWENLFYGCPSCNGKNYKGNRFPLHPGSSPLNLHQQPTDHEQALLVDPSLLDPLDHIRFAPDQPNGWGPVPLTDTGRWTIAVLGLHKRQGLRTHWKIAAKEVEEDADFKAAITACDQNDKAELTVRWENARRRLLFYEVSSGGIVYRAKFLALRWSVFDHHFPEDVRQRFSLDLPRPGQRGTHVPRPTRRTRPELDSLPPDLQSRVRKLGERTRPDEMRTLLVDLCRFAGMTLANLAKIVEREPSYLQNEYLTPLTQATTAELVFDTHTSVYRAW